MLNAVLSTLIVLLLFIMFWIQSKNNIEPFINDIPDKKSYPSDEIDKEFKFEPNIEEYQPPIWNAELSFPLDPMKLENYKYGHDQWHPQKIKINMKDYTAPTENIKMPFIPDHSKLIGSTTYPDETIVLPYNDNSEY